MNEELAAIRYSAAAQRLGCSERTVRRYVRDGLLKTVGEGQRRQVLLASIREFNEKKLDRGSGQIAKTAANALTLAASWLYRRHEMKHRIAKIRPLSTSRQAARELGLPVAQVESLMASHDIPSIKIGPCQFVTAGWLGKVLSQALQEVR